MSLNFDIEMYVDNSHHYRGWVINEFARLEKEIEHYILKNLKVLEICGLEIQTILLDRMTFEAKRSSFKKLLIEQDIKKKSNYKKLFDELVLLNEQRNRFAHYPLREEFLEDDSYKDLAISLIRFRDGYDFINYSQEDVQSIVNRIHVAINYISQLL